MDNTRHKNFRWVWRGLAAVLAGTMALPCLAQAQQGWLTDGYQYRRTITVRDSDFTRLPGDDIAVFSMTTGGHARPGGTDIRIVTPDGKERPHRILQYGPGDQVRIAFALNRGGLRYTVYFGPPKDKELAKPAAAPLDLDKIQRGVLLETWNATSGNIITLEQVQANFTTPNKKLLGVDFVPNVFLGVNPFGPDNRIARRFTGWFTITQAGEYAFASTSNDASFILIDDKKVVDCGGGKDVIAGIPEDKHQGRIHLTVGLHKLTYLHVNLHGDPTAVAAWAPPGTPRNTWQIIDPRQFVPVAHATVGALEQFGQPATLDFSWSSEGESFAVINTNDRYYQRLSFTSASFPTGAQRNDCVWDFGDGQTAKGLNVDHVFLRPGEYTVTVTARVGPNTISRSNRVFVQRPWARLLEEKIQEDLVKHLNYIRGYDFGKLPAGQSSEVIQLFEHARTSVYDDRREAEDERRDAEAEKRAADVNKLTAEINRLNAEHARFGEDIIRVGQSIVASGKISPEDIEKVMPSVNSALREKKKHAEAAELFLKAVELTKNTSSLALLKSMAGHNLLALRDEKSLDAAMALFDEVVRRHTAATGTSLRDSHIGRGDIWRLRRDGDKARRAYREAGIHQSALASLTPDLLRGDFVRHIEDGLRTRRFGIAQDYLDRWAYVFPADKVDGYWSMLKVKTAIAANQLAEAVDECEILLSCSPTSNYAAQLLMLQSEAHEKLKEPAKAKAALERLIEQYKESPLAVQAAKKLGVAPPR